MHPDPITNDNYDEELRQAEQRTFDTFVAAAQELMTPLIEMGLPIPSVLERGLSYMIAYRADPDWCANALYAARVVRQAAKNMGIDAESQERAMRESSREISERIRSSNF